MQIWDIVIALGLVTGGALYIRMDWHRSPRAYRAMIVLAGCYFVAGAMVGASIFTLTGPWPMVPPSQVATPSAAANPLTVAPTLKENYTGPSFPMPVLHYDPAHRSCLIRS
jgi:hypothetical protein